MPENPRQLALKVLDRLDRSDVLLDPLLEEVLADAPFSDSRDRTLFHTIVFGTLRWRARLDWVIASLSKTPLEKIDPTVLNILRIGLFQAVFLDRVPVSAAVNTSVELAKAAGTPSWVVGFVNAVLRNAAKRWEKAPLPDPKQNPARRMAVFHSLPEWLIRRWIDRCGKKQAEALCRAVNEIPPITARVNTILTGRPELIEALKKQCGEVRPGSLSPDAVIFRRPASAVSELDSHRKGWFQVQDEAAQLVVRLLDPRPGERILDACAGLGGKTGHIAQLMENRGRIVAADTDDRKLGRLAAEMNRLAVSVVDCVAADLLEAGDLFSEPFDRVLLDAPCSGLGVLRKNPDARWRTEKRDLERFANLQKRLLERAASWVRPGGRIVYSVCSTEPEEAEAVVAAFLGSRADFTAAPPPESFPESATALVDRNGFFHTAPHRNDTDGFFAASLVRAASALHGPPGI